MTDLKKIACEYAGAELGERELKQFETLCRELLETNKTTNLTAIRDEDGVYMKHFLDSLTLLKGIPRDAKTVADIGSGAGFPGLPLAIARPDLSVTMIESIGKKTQFIERCIEVLDLHNAKVIRSRAEDLPEEYKKKFDVVTARAVAFLPDLLGFCLPLVKPGGVFIAMKNDNDEEIEEAGTALETSGAYVEKKIPVLIPDFPPRSLIVIREK